MGQESKQSTETQVNAGLLRFLFWIDVGLTLADAGLLVYAGLFANAPDLVNFATVASVYAGFGNAARLYSMIPEDEKPSRGFRVFRRPPPDFSKSDFDDFDR